MFEKLVEWCARRVGLMLAVALVIASLGVYSWRKSPIDAIPDLTDTQVIVWTEWMGRSPQEVEEVIAAIPGVAEVGVTAVPDELLGQAIKAVIVLKDGALAYVFGTPGGETIGQTQFQVLLNLIDIEMPVQQAIEAPRLALNATPNFYRPGATIAVQVEGRVPAATIAALRAMGHTVEVQAGWGSLGHMQVIRVDPKTGARTAGADPRRTGYAMGY